MQNLHLFSVFGHIKHIILGHNTLKKILTGTETEKFVFYRDLKPKRLRTTDLHDKNCAPQKPKLTTTFNITNNSWSGLVLFLVEVTFVQRPPV